MMLDELGRRQAVESGVRAMGVVVDALRLDREAGMEMEEVPSQPNPELSLRAASRPRSWKRRRKFEPVAAAGN